MDVNILKDAVERIKKTLDKYHQGKNPEAIKVMGNVLSDIFNNTKNEFIRNKAADVRIYSNIYFSNKRENTPNTRNILLQIYLDMISYVDSKLVDRK